MNAAWGKFRTSFNGMSEAEVGERWRKSLHDYFGGRPHTELGMHEWDRFVADNFVKPAVADPIAGSPPEFDDMKIPF